MTIIHKGATTVYQYNEDPLVESLTVTGRENGIRTAVLTCPNKRGLIYPDNADVFDQVLIYQVLFGETIEFFRGTIRKVESNAQNKEFVDLKCKGTGFALENTNCSTNYGYTSVNPTDDTIKEIIDDLITNYVNLSYGSANNTGYALNSGLVETIDAGLSIPYVNFPYNKCSSVIDRLLMLDTAYRNGSTAGPHWIVTDFGGTTYLRVKTIGTTQASGVGQWGKYAGGTEAKVILKEGINFFSYTTHRSAGEYANNICLITDLRKPGYDYITEGQVANWDDTDVTLTDDAGGGLNEPAAPMVGTTFIRAASEIDGTCYFWYIDSEDLAWNVDAMGSSANPPRLNFYLSCNDVSDATQIGVNFFTARGADYYSYLNDAAAWTLQHALTKDDEWQHFSIPIGTYAEKGFLTNRRYAGSAAADINWHWSKTGNGDWSNINGIMFQFDGTADRDVICVDDLHISGKIIREAVDTSEVTAHDEIQLPIISIDALDDSCVASDDTGMAGAMAYAELLRRVNIPETIEFKTTMFPDLRAGEYFALSFRKRPISKGDITKALTFYHEEEDFRVLKYTHRIGKQGAYTHVTATDDLLNSFPITNMDQRSLLNEFMLVNNEEAKNMRSSGNVDLLVEHLRKPY